MTQNHEQKSEMSLADKRKLLAELLRQRASLAKQSYEAAPNQTAIAFMQLLEPGSPAYHIHSCIRIEGSTYPDFWRDIFQQLVDRHAMLRAVFHPREIQSLEIPGASTVSFTQIDGAGWSDQRLYEEVHRSFSQPFDLEKGPLFRIHLFSRGDGDHVLLLVAHHLICDGWSLFLIRKEIRDLCRAAEAGVQAVLPRPKAEFADYLREHKALLDGPQGQKFEAYWRNQFSTPVPPFRLRPDKPRPARRSGQQGDFHFLIPEGLYDKLKTQAQAQGTTIFAVVLAAYQVMLARYSNQDDFLIGFPVAGRTDERYEGVVGHFVNMVILRGNTAGDPTFAEMIRRTWEQLSGALANQEYPYCRLARLLRSQRSDPRAPLTSVMINFLVVTPEDQVVDLHFDESGPLRDLEHPQVRPYRLQSVGEHYDLALRFMDTKEKLFGRILFDLDLFDQESARDFATGMVTLLEHAVERPEVRLSQLVAPSPIRDPAKDAPDRMAADKVSVNKSGDSGKTAGDKVIPEKPVSQGRGSGWWDGLLGLLKRNGK